ASLLSRAGVPSRARPGRLALSVDAQQPKPGLGRALLLRLAADADDPPLAEHGRVEDLAVASLAVLVRPDRLPARVEPGHPALAIEGRADVAEQDHAAVLADRHDPLDHARPLRGLVAPHLLARPRQAQ